MIADHWPKYPLSEVCNLINGNGFKSTDWDTVGLPIIRIQNLNGSREFNYFSGEVQNKWLVEPGDLLFAWAGVKGVSFGPRIWSGPRGLLNQHIFRVVPKAVVTKEYLYAVMGLVTTRIEAKSHGFKANFVHVQRGDILDQLVSVPSLPVQKKIATIFSECDRAIELTEKLIAAKQQRKAALMQQLLTGKLRLPGFLDTHWKACELGDVASNSARRIGTGTPPPVYSVTNSVGMVPMDESVVGASIDRYKAVAKHDFAYNPMRINVGSIAMWEGDGEVLVSPDYVVFRCGPDLDPEFLNHYRTSHQWDQFVTKAGGGSVRVRIYFSDLAELPLKLPSVEEQKAIAAVLNTQDREIGLLQKKLDALRRQKKGLMQQLLTGRVRVRVESDSN